MTPHLISPIDFKDEYIKKALETQQESIIYSLIHYYFILSHLQI